MITPTFGDYLRHLRTGSTTVFPLSAGPHSRASASRTRLAADADISTGYLSKMEQGQAEHPSPEIVDRLAIALGVHELERQHMHDLASPMMPADARTQLVEITSAAREFVDNMHPHLSGYVDEAWNVRYTNREYARIYRRIDVLGNVLVWFFAERQSRKIMVEWESEARLTVAWLRSHMARRRNSQLFTTVLRELSRYPDFVRMWERREILMGRHTPYMRVRDLDRGEELTLRAQVFRAPDPNEALQIYIGVRVEDGQHSS